MWHGFFAIVFINFAVGDFLCFSGTNFCDLTKTDFCDSHLENCYLHLHDGSRFYFFYFFCREFFAERLCIVKKLSQKLEPANISRHTVS